MDTNNENNVLTDDKNNIVDNIADSIDSNIKEEKQDNKKNNRKENRKKNRKENKKKSNKKKAIYLILFILIFLIVGIVALKIWQIRNQNDYWLDRLAKNGIMEGRTLTEIQDLLNQVVDEGMFNVSINPEPVFRDGNSEGNIALENIPGNHYYTRVTISLKDTGEVIFKSGGIKPGQYIDYVKLRKKLSKGDYPAVAHFEITEPETLADIGRVNVDMTIHILN